MVCIAVVKLILILLRVRGENKLERIVENFVHCLRVVGDIPRAAVPRQIALVHDHSKGGEGVTLFELEAAVVHADFYLFQDLVLKFDLI